MKLMYFSLSISNNLKQFGQIHIKSTAAVIVILINKGDWYLNQVILLEGLSVMVEHHSGYQYWLTARYVMFPADATSLYDLGYLGYSSSLAQLS